MIVTGRCQLGDVMFHGQLAIQMNTEVADDCQRLDLARANQDVGVHVVQFGQSNDYCITNSVTFDTGGSVYWLSPDSGIGIIPRGHCMCCTCLQNITSTATGCELCPLCSTDFSDIRLHFSA